MPLHHFRKRPFFILLLISLLFVLILPISAQCQGVRVIDVTSYGAKLDGLNDDTHAIQKAVRAARYGDTVYIPYTPTGLVLNGTVRLLSGITIDGSGNTVLIRPSLTSRNVFEQEQPGLENVTIKNINFLSLNEYTRDEGGRSGLGSNLYIFHINGYKNLRLEDIRVENAEYFFKSERPSTGLYMKNIETIGVYQPFYCVDNDNVIGENIVFDCPLYGETTDHGFYINGGSQNMNFYNVTLKNGSGQCFKVSNDEMVYGAPNENIVVEELYMYNVYSGIFIVAGDAANIHFRNVYGDTLRGQSQYWLLTGYCDIGRIIQNISMENFYLKNAAGGLYMNELRNDIYTNNVRLVNGTVDGCNPHLQDDLLGVNDLYHEDIIFTGANPYQWW